MEDSTKKTIGIIATVIIIGGLGFVIRDGEQIPCSLEVGNYAETDAKGVVKNIIVADECFIQSGAVGDPTLWVLTDYSVPEKAANINGKYDATAKEFITKEDVKKYGDTIKVTDIIKPVKDKETVSTTTP